jgi:hypothetical protein
MILVTFVTYIFDLTMPSFSNTSLGVSILICSETFLNYFLKFIFDINISKLSENIKKIKAKTF